MGCKGVVTRIPDHSLMSWEVEVDCVGEREEEEVDWCGKEVQGQERYLESEVGEGG